MLKLAIGCDHGGYALKTALLSYLNECGYACKDFGGLSVESRDDYPDVAFPLAEAVARGEFDRGILICTTGIGMSMCANKVFGVRCALCTDAHTAYMTRHHNDTNVLAVGAGLVSEETAKEIVSVWLSEPFDGERHARRIGKIAQYEEAHMR